MSVSSSSVSPPFRSPSPWLKELGVRYRESLKANPRLSDEWPPPFTVSYHEMKPNRVQDTFEVSAAPPSSYHTQALSSASLMFVSNLESDKSKGPKISPKKEATFKKPRYKTYTRPADFATPSKAEHAEREAYRQNNPGCSDKDARHAGRIAYHRHPQRLAYNRNKARNKQNPLVESSQTGGHQAVLDITV
jgi:hypothetical protein